MAATLHPVVGGDGLGRFNSMQALLGDGGKYAKYSLVLPVLSVPLAWAGDLFGIERIAAVAYFNVLFFFAFSGLIYQQLSIRYSPRVGRLWLLLMAAGSMFPHHLQNYYGEVVTALAFFLGVLWIRRHPFAAAVLMAVACANTPALLPPFLVLALAWFVLEEERVPLAAFALAAGLVALDAWIKHGSEGAGYFSRAEHGFKTMLPYSGLPGFSYPLPLGIMGITLSFGKGLVFFIPGLLLIFSAQLRRQLGLDERRTTIAVLALFLPVLLYSKWWAWYGGSFWGPRFFLYLCPPACLLLAMALQDQAAKKISGLLVLPILLLSLWVGLDGYMFGQNDMEICAANNYANEHFCWYVPEFSALWRPFITGRIQHLYSDQRHLFAMWHAAVLIYLSAACVVPAVRELAGYWQRIRPDWLMRNGSSTR